MRYSLIVFTLIFFSTLSKAAILDMGSYVQDTETQLDWLKLGATDGLSIKIAKDNNPLYQLASKVQVRELFNNYYGGSPLDDVSNYDVLDYAKTDSFIELLGITHKPNNNTVRTGGYVSEQFSSSTHQVSRFSAIDNANPSRGEFNEGISGEPKNVSNPLYGSFLVRSSSTISAVPEPQTYAMFLVGLGLLGFSTRNKRT